MYKCARLIHYGINAKSRVVNLQKSTQKKIVLVAHSIRLFLLKLVSFNAKGGKFTAEIQSLDCKQRVQYFLNRNKIIIC